MVEIYKKELIGECFDRVRVDGGWLYRWGTPFPPASVSMVFVPDTESEPVVQNPMVRK